MYQRNTNVIASTAEQKIRQAVRIQRQSIQKSGKVEKRAGKRKNQNQKRGYTQRGVLWPLLFFPKF